MIELDQENEILDKLEGEFILPVPAAVSDPQAEEDDYEEEEYEDDEDNLESEPPRAIMGRPRKYAEGTPRIRKPVPRKVNTASILAEIQKFRDENPTKKTKEIHSIFFESRRDWIVAKLFDTAENGDTPTIRFNAQARLKDELDGRVATQDKKDPDEDDAIGKILLPEEM